MIACVLGGQADRGGGYRRIKEENKMEGFEMGGKIYAAALGALYAVFGVIEVVFVFSGTDALIPADFFGGLVSLVIASTYLAGVKDMRENDFRGIAMLMGGLFLSVVFGVLYLMLMCADFLMYVLGESEEFSVIASLRPEIWLFVAAIPLAYHTWRMLKDVPW